MLADVQSFVIQVVAVLKLMLDVIGASVLSTGVVVALARLVRSVGAFDAEKFNATRLTLASYLVLALEFQLGADILSTAISPSWDQIGKLGAIAVIRTGLNYFLLREVRGDGLTGGGHLS